MTESSQTSLSRLLTEIRDGLDHVASETARLADLQERTLTHLCSLSGQSVYTRVHLAAAMQFMRMALPKVTEASLAKVMSIELDKANERGWIEALEQLDETSRRQATLPSETMEERLARFRAQRKERQAEATAQERPLEEDRSKSEAVLAERHLDRTRGRER